MCMIARSVRKSEVSAVSRTLALLAASMLLSAGAAFANTYSAALKARNYEKAERAADTALTADQNDPDALYAKVEAIIATAPESRIDEAVSLAEKCVAAHPQQSACFEARGNALGTKARKVSSLSAMGFAGKIRDSYYRAVELDPKNFSARYSLQQYYLAAPAVVGGGMEKAKGLAAETAKLNAGEGHIMQALIALKGRDPEGAEREIGTISGNVNDTLSEQRRDVLWSIGESYLAAKHFADADRVFHKLQSAYPDSELGPFGLARSLQEEGQHAQAVPLFEKALKIYPQADIYYRMAQSLQASGYKARALNTYEKSLSMEPGLAKKQRIDAQNQVKSLE